MINGISFYHGEYDDRLRKWVKDNNFEYWFAKDPLRYTAMMQEDKLLYVFVHLKEIQLHGKTWIEYAGLTDYKSAKKSFIKPFTREQKRKIRDFAVYQFGIYVFEMLRTSGGVYSLTPASNKIALLTMRWLDFSNVIEDSGNVNSKKETLYRWYFSREHWESGVIQQRAMEAVTDF